mmetsp:Transcript_3080/g.6776  ORF Transcript_3080/g.6776 Transcript_3080/m.6776 type:complete len:132 (+) Transcript_3080:532-927(+)
MISVLSFLSYSTVVVFATVAGHDTVGCMRTLGGEGCNKRFDSTISANETIGLYVNGSSSNSTFYSNRTYEYHANGSLSVNSPVKDVLLTRTTIFDSIDSALALGFVSMVLLFCYGTNFYLSYLPILRGDAT